VFRVRLLGFSAGVGKFYVRPVLRRLFSTFAHGWPGTGLLLIRLVVGITSVVRRIIELQIAPPISLVVIHVLAIAAGILLLAGLWTPIAGVLLAIIEIWSAFTHPHDPWSYILLGTLGVALAMLGPGAWSVDARLFGWKRIDPPDRKS
jgi:putative oxidoreductase